MKIYFAASVRAGRSDSDIYEYIVKLLLNYGQVLTEHLGDKKLTDQGEENKTEKYIYDRDMKWLKESDVLVAEVTQPSLGVGYEIAMAEKMNKKILCLWRPTPNTKLSAMLCGSDKVKIKEYSETKELKTIFDEFFN